jgi:hypothetical protein
MSIGKGDLFNFYLAMVIASVWQGAIPCLMLDFHSLEPSEKSGHVRLM